MSTQKTLLTATAPRDSSHLRRSERIQFLLESKLNHTKFHIRWRRLARPPGHGHSTHRPADHRIAKRWRILFRRCCRSAGEGGGGGGGVREPAHRKRRRIAAPAHRRPGPPALASAATGPAGGGWREAATQRSVDVTKTKSKRRRRWGVWGTSRPITPWPVRGPPRPRGHGRRPGAGPRAGPAYPPLLRWLARGR